MPDNNSKPVVLLIYANTGPALDCLKPETETIAAHLEATGLCDVRVLPAATLSDVVTAINDPVLRDRVAIVHYAGHANGQGIQLQSTNATTQGAIAYMRGLAEVLKHQPHLRLLFINGCASREQVLELTQAGIPLVIATNRGIDDKVARDFAECFYRTLGQQRSIADAFRVATGMLKSAAGDNVRGMYFGEFQASAPATKSELPWELHGPDTDRHWSLREPYYRGTGPRWDHTKFPFNSESPYLGLRYFEEEESSRFFGRDDFVQTLLAASDSAPLLLVIGASGTGKSSVVRAGMIPHWKKQRRSESRGRAFVFTPQDDPFEQLSTALASVDAFNRQQIRSIREAPSRTALRDAVKTFGQGEPWLFFVDQFEQIFTRTTDQKKRADFLDAITDLAKSEHPNVCLVLAMRDDFFPQLRDYPELFPLTDTHCFRVAALNRAALEEVIQRPAAMNGVSFQPGLVVKIIDAIDRQPGALPLLQYALNRLWNEDDLSDRLLNETTYTGFGGVTGSLGLSLQALYDQQESDKDQFRWMMLKLVTYDENATGSSVVSRLAPKSEFAGTQVELLDQLIAQGLVVSSGTSTPSVQLGHEKIIEAWPEFSKWTQEYREANTVRQQLTKAASEWAGLRARDEKQKATRALWQGSQLEKALELRQRGDFDQLGGLAPHDKEFLDASHSRSQRLIRRLQLAVGIALVLAIFGWWNYNEAEKARNNLENTNTLLENKTQEANRQTANAYWQVATNARDRNQGVKATHYFLRAAQALDSADDQRRCRNIELAAQFATAGLVRSFVHDSGVHGILFTHDESRVLVWSGDGGTGAVTLWDVTKPEPLQVWQHNGGVNGVKFTRDESHVLAWSDDGAVKLWDVAKVEPLQVWKHDRQVNGAVFTHDESRILAWSGESGFDGHDRKPGEVKLWDVTKTEPLQIWKHEGRVRGAAFTRDESRVLAWNEEGTAMLYDVTQAEPLQVWQHDDSVLNAVFSHNESRVLAWTGSSDMPDQCPGEIKLWDVTKAEPLQVWKHEGRVNGAKFSHDESLVLAWSGNQGESGSATLWDVTKSEPLHVWKHDRQVNGAAFTRDESRVLAWSGDLNMPGVVTLWDVTKDEPLQVWNHGGWVEDAVFARDESRVLAWSRNGNVKIWDLKQTEPIQVLQHEGNVYGAKFTTDESRILSWSGCHGKSGTVTLWDVTKSQPLHVWTFRGIVCDARFTRDESRVLAWSREGEMNLWDVTKVEPIQVWEHFGDINGAVFTRDESRILSWSGEFTNGEIKLWDVTKAKPLQVWLHGDAVFHAGFTRDESRVLAWSGGDLSETPGEVTLSDVTKPEPLQVWKRDRGLNGAVFTRDESRVLGWSGNFYSPGEVTLWDVTKAVPLQVWKHSRCVNGAEFTRDESRIIAWSGNDVVDTPNQDPQGEIQLLNVTQVEPLRVWQHDGNVTGAVLTRDESRVLAWSHHGAMALRNLERSEPIQVWNKGGVRGAVFTRDESRVLSWHFDGAVILWEVTKSEPLQVWSHDWSVERAVFTRDESRVLSWSDDGAVKLWDVAKVEPLQVWKQGDNVRSAAFTHDETRVLAWSRGRAVKLWDVAKPEPLQVWTHDAEVNGAVFTRDESRVLTWCDDGTVRLWDETHSEPLHIWNHNGRVGGALFTRDESRVLTWGTFAGDVSHVIAGKNNGQIKLWDSMLRDVGLSPAERILEFQIRSASRLDLAGELVPLSSAEWITLVRSPEYSAIQIKQKAAERGGSSK